jgi:hypothetical protein
VGPCLETDSGSADLIETFGLDWFACDAGSLGTEGLDGGTIDEGDTLLGWEALGEVETGLGSGL